VATGGAHAQAGAGPAVLADLGGGLGQHLGDMTAAGSAHS
jgi:hypothetical protein